MFLKGQWIDALDTVNEWLEATVLDLSRDGTEVLPLLAARRVSHDSGVHVWCQ